MTETISSLTVATTHRAYLGGSFNPVHLGHIAMALTVQKTLQSHGCPFVVSLMPSNNPFKVNTSHTINNDDRLAMLRLASTQLDLAIESYELSYNDKPTYTIDTLKALKARHPNDTLIFIIGQDSLESLPTWKNDIALLNYAHLWVFDRNTALLSPKTRPNKPTNTHLSKALKARLTQNISNVLCNTNGWIYQDTTVIPAISSSLIRQNVSHHRSIDKLTLPSVADYIAEHKLYR